MACCGVHPAQPELLKTQKQLLAVPNGPKVPIQPAISESTRLSLNGVHETKDSLGDSQRVLDGEVMLLLTKIMESQGCVQQLLQQQHESVTQHHEALSKKMDDMAESMDSSGAGQSHPSLPFVFLPHEVSDGAPPKMSILSDADFDSTENHEFHTPNPETAMARRSSEITQDSNQGPAPSRIRQVLTHTYFELAMSVVILANTGAMFVSLQLKGMHQAMLLGLSVSDDSWEGTAKGRFEILENGFNAIYLVELILRLYVFGKHFFRGFSNCVDFVIVLSSCIDGYILQPMQITFINVAVLRLVRLSRVLRVTKFLRFSENLSELRILLRTLKMALRGIVWSVVLLFGIITAGGILMAQFAINYLEVESISIERRIWLYSSFGTTTGSIYTMFECTFTGHWWAFARPLIEEVSELFALFWIIWIIIVNFMTMRVVGALFLKQTMAVAAQDDEKVAMDQQKRRGKIASALRVIFSEVDSSGDGSINQDEFDSMLESPHVLAEFSNLGLDIDEVCALFSVLTSDDGEADSDEFICGALAMSTSSPTLDAMKSLQNQMKIAKGIDDIITSLQPMRRAMGLQPSRCTVKIT